MTEAEDAPKDYRRARSVSIDPSTDRDIEWIKSEFGATTTSEVVRRAIKHLAHSLRAEAVYFEVDGNRRKANIP